MRTASVWGMLRQMADGGGTFGYTPFKSLFCDPVNGNDAYDGLTLSGAKKTLAAAFALATAGANDTIYLVSNGESTGTARVDAAFDWSKSATHLIGICAPSLLSLRSRIAPTATTTAFTPFFTVSGSGCFFENVQWWHGFNTGVAAAICMTVTGYRNVFRNCHIAGMGDAASAQSSTSRSLKIGADENLFQDCVIGIDTIARTVANTTIEFYANPTSGTGAARNIFRHCLFPAWTTTVQTQTDIYAAAAAALDRVNVFDGCEFSNSRQATGYLIQTAVAALPASAGGDILFRNCSLLGRTGFGKDATTRGFLLVDGGPPVAGTTGLSVAPTA